MQTATELEPFRHLRDRSAGAANSRGWPSQGRTQESGLSSGHWTRNSRPPSAASRTSRICCGSSSSYSVSARQHEVQLLLGQMGGLR